VQTPAQQGGGLSDILFRGTGKTGRGDSIAETFTKTMTRQLAGSAGRTLVRGMLGGLFKSR
jgi:hypothetical protein